MNYFITTPIYYVNDSPHLGHAYTTVAADVMARYQRLKGNDVKFLTGTDEHGQKVDKAAKNANIDPQAFTDEVSQRFQDLVNMNFASPSNFPTRGAENKNLLNISNDDFIRTTESRHKKACQHLWQKLEQNGYIYKSKYAGWYSVRDEAYYQESELMNGKAPTGAEVEWVEEESYFFKLSEFQDRLLALYDEQKDFIIPNTRMNEIKSFVKGGLKDLSISRTTFNWGVPVPGDERHVMYVWIDALTNYMTACGYPENNKFWQQDTEITHVVGKDIIRFHAVYWPAFLMAADLPLPKKIVAHGWWTVEGEKMSKSIGNVISPYELVEKYGLDQTRYFLMRSMPFGNDGDLSQSRLIEVVNAELANNIGNLAQRTLSQIFKNFDGKIPNVKSDRIEDHILRLSGETAYKHYTEWLDKFSFHEAQMAIIQFASQANEYIDAKAPWTLRKENKMDEMAEVLYNLADAIRVIAILLQPFCPDSAAKILDQLNIPQQERSFTSLSTPLAQVGEIPEPKGVFARLQ